VICVLCVLSLNFIFFFSSRRRHTRCYRDWSSDVCSSDLQDRTRSRRRDESDAARHLCRAQRALDAALRRPPRHRRQGPQTCARRSEERRVGKECRSRWWAYNEKKNTIESRKEKCQKQKNE